MTELRCINCRSEKLTLIARLRCDSKTDINRNQFSLCAFADEYLCECGIVNIATYEPVLSSIESRR